MVVVDDVTSCAERIHADRIDALGKMLRPPFGAGFRKLVGSMIKA
jgi:hypothetical protein